MMTDCKTIPSGGPANWLRHWSVCCSGKTACIDEHGHAWTYERLYGAVHRVSGWLREMEVLPGSVVLIYVSGLFHQRLLRLATCVIGASDALIDPSLSHRELQERIALLRPVLIVTEYADGNARSAALPRDLVNEINGPRDAQFHAQTDRRHSRILFTTGSTGKPKAVELSEYSIDAAAAANISVRRLRTDDVLLSLLPAYHAAGSMFEDSLLKLGGMIVLPDKREKDYFLVALEKYPVTVTSVVPSQLQPVLQREKFPESLNKMRLINVAGEKIKHTLLDDLRAGFQGQITRGYGLTEAGPLVSVYFEKNGTAQLNTTANVGKAAPGVSIKIESDGNEEGELLVKSPHLMIGYYGDREGTSKKIVDGWLRTGDIAKIINGNIHLMGRTGNRMKSGGEWIHPAEIEAVIETLPFFREAVVVPKKDHRWGERPVVFFTSTAQEFDGKAVAKALSGTLSKYKWPDWYQKIESMPKNGVGKIDYCSLQKMAQSGPYPDSITLDNSKNQPARKENLIL